MRSSNARGRPPPRVLALAHHELDISDRERVLQVCGEWEPDLVINAAAFTAVDACEETVDEALPSMPSGLATWRKGQRHAGAHLVHISTDYVFDGKSPVPYVEWDRTGPLSVYGRSKLGGETEVLSLAVGATVVRTRGCAAATAPTW